jgi:uncharacterized protein YqeY
VSDTLKARLQADLNQARRDRDKDRLGLLSMTLSEVKNREIELGGEADDEEVQSVVGRAIKRRREAAEQMRAGGREELAAREDAEALVLSAYLPPGLTEDEVRAMIREILDSGVEGIGPVMGRLSGRIKGRFDGKEANRLVREALAS